MKKNLLQIILSLCVVYILNPEISSATKYYISPSGNDGNAGTSIGGAWQTVANINSMNIQPGDTFLFEGRQTFTGGIYMDDTDANDSTAIVLFSSYGTGKAIISSGTVEGFYAYNTQGIAITNLIFEGGGINSNTTDGIYFYTDLAGEMKLTNVSILRTEVRQYGGTGIDIGAWATDNTNSGFKNILIDSVEVHDVKENGITTWGYWDQFNVGWSHQNVIVRYVHVHDVPGYPASGHRGSGIILAQLDSGLMEYCVAHDNGSGNTHCGGPGGIWAWDSNNLTIQFCEAYRNHSGTGGCDGLGFDFDGGMTNSIMQYNYTHDNDGAGMLLGQFDYSRPWFNNIIRYNISENDGRTNGGGITLFKGPGTTMTGSHIYQNTVYVSPTSGSNPDQSAFNIVDWDTGIDSTEVYNNIFQTTGNIPLVKIPAGYQAYFANNLYWSTGGTFSIDYDGSTYTNLASWRTATGNEKIGTTSTGIVADPILTNAGAGGTVYPSPVNQLNAYHLPMYSPAINAGINLLAQFGINSGTRDFFGNTNLTGIAPDLGAAESSFITTAYKNSAVGNVLAYPNPVIAGNNVTVFSTEIISSTVVKDISGKIVSKDATINLKSSTFSTNNLSPGIYFIVITEKSGLIKSSRLAVE